jgi:hypothetical protein
MFLEAHSGRLVKRNEWNPPDPGPSCSEFVASPSLGNNVSGLVSTLLYRNKIENARRMEGNGGEIEKRENAAGLIFWCPDSRDGV